MCGISGIVSLNGNPVSAQEVRRMCAALSHRGPDDEGFYLGSTAALGMRRLSIIDLVTGAQPVRNEDGSIWVVFNGEIYNFADLRRDLLRRGHAFYTATDTETIVHLYEEYAEGCVERLRGMFAFALWDERRKTLLLARDRLGIKPLYYAEVGGRLAFASELKAILELPEIQRTINWRSAAHVFSFLTTPPSESIIEGVRKLEPGCLLIASAGRPTRLQRYWDVSFRPETGTSEETFVERVRGLLSESVRLHTISDVPVGAFLSGGLDSSAVVATMSRLASGPVRTFSVGFGESAFDETSHAREVARRFGTEHREVILGPEVADCLEDLAWHLDEPFGDSSAIPTYMVSKLASEHVKVVLSGDGGDELFAGYDRYVVEARERRYEALPGAARRVLRAVGAALPEGMRGRRLLQHVSLSGADRYLDAAALFRRQEQSRLFRPEVLERMAGYDPWSWPREVLGQADGGWLAALQYLDLKAYLPLDILTKVDRMSMAHSLEVRVPLLDHRLVELAATIPPELRLLGGSTKHIFKKALRGILPDAIIDRRKHGFAIPLGGWFRGPLRHAVRDILLSDTARRRGIFDDACIERLLRRHQRGRGLDLHIWTLLSFELWCRAFLDRRRPAHAWARRPARHPDFSGAARARSGRLPSGLAS